MFENILSEGLACKMAVFLIKRKGHSRICGTVICGTVISGFTKRGLMKQTWSAAHHILTAFTLVDLYVSMNVVDLFCLCKQTQ